MLARTAFSTNPSKGPRNSIRLVRSSWNTSQIVRSLNSGCWVPFGVGNALIFQPRIQFGEALYPRLGPEHLVAQIADLVLDLTLLPSRGRRAGHRLDQMVRAHLQKAEIILGAPCRRRSPRRPSSCCRRCRAGRPRHRTGTPCRGRQTPAPGSRESRRAQTACGCATASCAPP